MLQSISADGSENYGLGHHEVFKSSPGKWSTFLVVFLYRFVKNSGWGDIFGWMILDDCGWFWYTSQDLLLKDVLFQPKQLFRQGHPFKELDLNPAAVYTKKRRAQRLLLELETTRVAVGNVTSHSDLMSVVLETGPPELVTCRIATSLVCLVACGWPSHVYGHFSHCKWLSHFPKLFWDQQRLQEDSFPPFFKTLGAFPKVEDIPSRHYRLWFSQNVNPWGLDEGYHDVGDLGHFHFMVPQVMVPQLWYPLGDLVTGVQGLHNFITSCHGDRWGFEWMGRPAFVPAWANRSGAYRGKRGW